MNHHYNDIRSRIQSKPLWFDENAVPRYEPFNCRDRANIYAKEVTLLEIACQNCGHRFDVCMTNNWNGPTLRQQIEDGLIHYGDPPNVQCCMAGPTMNCLDLRVIEYWHNPKIFEWIRVTELEIVLPDGTEYAHRQEAPSGHSEHHDGSSGCTAGPSV